MVAQHLAQLPGVIVIVEALAAAALGALTDDDDRRLLRSLGPEHPPGAH